MWPDTFEQRLKDWYALRLACQKASVHQALLDINDWWFRCPQVNHYLHYDGHETWPGPWDLLADNHFCDVARALGIVYTVMMLGRQDIESVIMIELNEGNLVQVNQGKYILNWCPGDILNNQPAQKFKKIRSLDSEKLRHLLG
jgi:hypothetical protein